MSDLKRLDESNAYLGEAVALANSRADELERLCHELAEAKEWLRVRTVTQWAAEDAAVRLRRELAEARWLLNHAVTRDTVAEWTQRRDAFLASDQPPAADCEWCKGSGRCINGEIWSWTSDGPVRGKCGCVCHTTPDKSSGV